MLYLRQFIKQGACKHNLSEHNLPVGILDNISNSVQARGSGQA